MELKPGMKLAAPGTTTEVVVVRPPSSPVAVTCAGVEMVDQAAGVADAPAPSGAGEDVLIGKRYLDEDSGLELLCSKAGAGPLAADGRDMSVKGAQPLPSSD
jgi:hypothetical protein